MTDKATEKKAYSDKFQAKLDKMNAQIDELKAKAKQAKADAAINYHERIEELEVKRNQTQDKLKELQQASGEAWEDIKDGFESAWGELQGSWEKAMEKFKS
jgi:uncharacterized coiled-coil DUF342 family protein